MSKKIPKATHPGEVRIGNLVLPCAVLDDGTRVLSQRGLYRALGTGVPGISGQRRLSDWKGPAFLAAKNLIPFVPEELTTTATAQIPYWHPGPQGGRIQALGIRAELIPKICDVWLKARDAGVLHYKQASIAKNADLLMRGLAHVGIIALIDEATGYQHDRSSRALAEILERFIGRELAAWAKTFPDDFYKEMFRLRDIHADRFDRKRPSYFGHLTNDVVYKRLAPGVLAELRRKNPPNEVGRRAAHHHRWLTREFGHPLLREHLAKVITLMKICKTWYEFKALLDRVVPKFGSTIPLLPPEND